MPVTYSTNSEANNKGVVERDYTVAFHRKVKVAEYLTKVLFDNDTFVPSTLTSEEMAKVSEQMLEHISQGFVAFTKQRGNWEKLIRHWLSIQSEKVAKFSSAYLPFKKDCIVISCAYSLCRLFLTGKVEERLFDHLFAIQVYQVIDDGDLSFEGLIKDFGIRSLKDDEKDENDQEDKPEQKRNSDGKVDDDTNDTKGQKEQKEKKEKEKAEDAYKTILDKFNTYFGNASFVESQGSDSEAQESNQASDPQTQQKQQQGQKTEGQQEQGDSSNETTQNNKMDWLDAITLDDVSTEIERITAKIKEKASKSPIDSLMAYKNKKDAKYRHFQSVIADEVFELADNVTAVTLCGADFFLHYDNDGNVVDTSSRELAAIFLGLLENFQSAIRSQDRYTDEDLVVKAVALVRFFLYNFSVVRTDMNLSVNSLLITLFARNVKLLFNLVDRFGGLNVEVVAYNTLELPEYLDHSNMESVFLKLLAVKLLQEATINLFKYAPDLNKIVQVELPIFKSVPEMYSLKIGALKNLFAQDIIYYLRQVIDIQRKYSIYVSRILPKINELYNVVAKMYMVSKRSYSKIEDKILNSVKLDDKLNLINDVANFTVDANGNPRCRSYECDLNVKIEEAVRNFNLILERDKIFIDDFSDLILKYYDYVDHNYLKGGCSFISSSSENQTFVHTISRFKPINTQMRLLELHNQGTKLSSVECRQLIGTRYTEAIRNHYDNNYKPNISGVDSTHVNFVGNFEDVVELSFRLNFSYLFNTTYPESYIFQLSKFSGALVSYIKPKNTDFKGKLFGDSTHRYWNDQDTTVVTEMSITSVNSLLKFPNHKYKGKRFTCPDLLQVLFSVDPIDLNVAKSDPDGFYDKLVETLQQKLFDDQEIALSTPTRGDYNMNPLYWGITENCTVLSPYRDVNIVPSSVAEFLDINMPVNLIQTARTAPIIGLSDVYEEFSSHLTADDESIAQKDPTGVLERLKNVFKASSDTKKAKKLTDEMTLMLKKARLIGANSVAQTNKDLYDLAVYVMPRGVFISDVCFINFTIDKHLYTDFANHSKDEFLRSDQYQNTTLAILERETGRLLICINPSNSAQQIVYRNAASGVKLKLSKKFGRMVYYDFTPYGIKNNNEKSFNYAIEVDGKLVCPSFLYRSPLMIEAEKKMDHNTLVDFVVEYILCNIYNFILLYHQEKKRNGSVLIRLDVLSQNLDYLESWLKERIPSEDMPLTYVSDHYTSKFSDLYSLIDKVKAIIDPLVAEIDNVTFTTKASFENFNIKTRPSKPEDAEKFDKRCSDYLAVYQSLINYFDSVMLTEDMLNVYPIRPLTVLSDNVTKLELLLRGYGFIDCPKSVEKIEGLDILNTWFNTDTAKYIRESVTEFLNQSFCWGV